MLPCNGCAYRREIPGDCHSRCAFDWERSKLSIPRNERGGRTMQWFRFPFNYDPVWGPDTCEARAEVEDKTKLAPANPLADLLSILR
jgi:hypothetical protein